MKFSHKLVKEAINSMVFSHPFFASILLQLEIVEDYNCETFWVDGKKLGFNPDYADTLTFEENKGVLAHEVMHVILLHFARMKNRDRKLWNKATDYVINWQLKRSGFQLPKGVLLDSKYSNANAEDVYRILWEEKQQKEQEKQKQNQQNKDSESEDSQGGSSGENEESDDEENDESDSSNEGSGDSESENSEDGEENSDSSGSGSGSSDEDSEDDDYTDFGEVREGEENPEQAAEKVKVMVSMAEKAAKLCGNVPAGIERMIEDMRKPKHDWREILNRFLNEQAAKDYSFLRANRRHLGRGIILPSLYSKTIGKVVVAVDTSGSVTNEEVNKMLTELTGMIDMMNEDKSSAEIEIIYCDATICGVETYSGQETFNPKGGGGTDFAPVFKYIEENQLNPDCMIYITDGYCWSFGNIVPEYPVLWGLTVSYNDFRPPFGEKFNFDIHGV